MTTTASEARPSHRTETPRLEGVPDGLQPEDLDRLIGTSDDMSADEKKAHIEEMLRAHGLNADTEDEQSLEDYNFARGIYDTVLSTNGTQWLGIPEGQQLNRRELVANAIAEWYEPRLIESRYEGRHRAVTKSEVTEEPGTEATSTEDSSADLGDSDTEDVSEVPTPAGSLLDDETRALVHDEMNQRLDEYAQKVAKRSRSIVESAKTGAAIEAAGTELSDVLSGIASEMYAGLAAQGVEEHQIIKTVDQFIESMTEKTLAKVEAYRLAEYNNSRPYLQKMYDKWAEWSADNRKLTGGRLKKALAFAVPGAAVGLVLSPLVGAVGVGVLTGAVAVTGGRSIARHLANGFMKKRDKRFAETQTDEMRAEIDGIYAQNDAKAEARKASSDDGRVLPRPEERNLDLIEFVNKRSREYRVRNRNRLLAGTAIAMSVGLLSSTVADALNGGDWAFGKLHNPFGGHDATTGGGTGNTPSSPVPPEQIKMPGETLAPTEHLHWNDFDPEARIVEPGEGGFQTLQEMGIPANKWEAIWQDAGSKLHGEGKTYTMADGRWGWDRTMRLSNHDLNVIAKAAERHGVTLS